MPKAVIGCGDGGCGKVESCDEGQTDKAPMTQSTIAGKNLGVSFLTNHVMYALNFGTRSSAISPATIFLSSFVKVILFKARGLSQTHIRHKMALAYNSFVSLLPQEQLYRKPLLS